MVDNSFWSWGLFLAINCQQDMLAAGSNRSFADLDAGNSLDGFSRSAAQRAICAKWNLAALPPAATEYVQSEVPALVLAGPSFTMPVDVYIAPGLAGSGGDISIGDPRGIAWIETTSIIGILVMLFSLIALFGLGLAWLVKGRKQELSLNKTATAACLLTLMLIVAVLAIPVLTTQINAEYLGRNEMLYSLGPSRDFGPAVLLAWITPLAGLLILVLAVMTLWAWLARRWSRSFRVLTSMVVLTSLPMVILGLRWGLFTMLL